MEKDAALIFLQQQRRDLNNQLLHMDKRVFEEETCKASLYRRRSSLYDKCRET